VAVVRVARQGDLEAVLGLLEDLRWDRQSAAPASGALMGASGGGPARAEAGRTWESILAQEGRFVLVAELAGEIVGTADLLIVQNLTHDLRPWAIVEHVVVADRTRSGASARRRGVGRALLAEAVARAQAAGCYKVQLLSRKDRSDAHRFYRAVGFEPTAEGFRRYLV
jgi:GNAT superfamily N-acetyltransferase